MWYLKSLHDDSLHKFLLGKQYKINRKGGDLVLPKDQSISRNHAVIDVTTAGEVYVIDEGSKYGTYLNEGIDQNVKIEPNQKYRIKNGDKVRFGLQWNIWQLHKTDMTVCTSTISGEEKKKLISTLTKIGVKLSSDWDTNCTHLVMNAVSLTRKVVCALACAKPITTVEYWVQLESAIENQGALPKTEDFEPSVAEEQLQKVQGSILPNEERKTLFSGKVFVFSSEEAKSRNKAMVECAGGCCQLESNSKITPELCCGPDHIVIVEGENDKEGSRFKAILSKYHKDFSEDSDQTAEEAKRGIVIPPSFPSCPSRDLESCKSEKRTPVASSSGQTSKRQSSQWLDKSHLNACTTNETDSAETSFARQPTSPATKDSSRRDIFDLDTQETQKRETRANCATDTQDPFKKDPPHATATSTQKKRNDGSDQVNLATNKETEKSSRKRYIDEDDDPFHLPLTTAVRKSSKRRQIIDDDEDFSKLPSTSGIRSKKTREDDDPFALPPTEVAIQGDGNVQDRSAALGNTTKKRSLASNPTTSRQNDDDPFKIPTSSRQSDDTEKENKKRKAANQLEEESRGKKRNQESPSSDSTTSGKSAFKITLANFLDKTIGSIVKVEKKEYGEEQVTDTALCDLIGKICVEETSLFRPQLRLQQESEPRPSVRNGGPNFKGFKKARFVQTVRHRQQFTFALEPFNLSHVSDQPDEPSQIPVPSTSTASSQETRLFDLFPRISRQKKDSRRPNAPKDDDWAVPL